MDEQVEKHKVFEKDVSTIKNFYVNEESDYALRLYNQALIKLEQNRLDFKVKDIRYIIVNNEEDVINLIEDINNSNYDSGDKIYLYQK